MADILVILTTTSFSTAQIISSKLESSKIECFLKNVNLIQPSIGSGVQILVNESDLELAFSLLQNMFSEFTLPSHSYHEDKDFSRLFIVPIDFSLASENACYFAIDLAWTYKARVKFIHAYNIPDMRPISFDDADFYQTTITSQLFEMRQEAELKFAQLTAKLKAYIEKQKMSVPISTYLINGLPDEITLYSVENENASLIIMGVSKTEQRAFEPMGKIADRISERSEIPVLVVPEETYFSNINYIKNVLYLTDFDESDFGAVRKLLSVLKLLKTKVFCLHISTEARDPWDKIKIVGLSEYFRKIDPNVVIECDLMVSEDIIKALNEFIIEKNINLISVTTHKRNLISKILFPSMSHKILFHTTIPILFFRG